MVLRIQRTLVRQRKRILPGLIALSVLAGVIVSVIATPSAQADYFTGCGYGYNSGQSGFGFGPGAGHAYGFGYGGAFGYGYGNEVCPLAVTTTSLADGTVGTGYSQTLTGTGGTGSYTWTETGSLDGLSLSSGGVITGSPSSSGFFPITVTMTDGNGMTASKALSITVSSGGGGGGGGGGTTTTAPTTTTTGPTTTTTGPTNKQSRFFCHGVHGFGLPGRTLTMNIFGLGFFAQPKITSNAFGTRFGVLHDRGNVLVTRVTVRGGSGLGWHTLTVRLANGRTCKANYSVKKL